MNKPFVTIKYKTADGSQICVEVSTSVKELLEQSDRQIRSQRRQDRRYLDFMAHTDEDLTNSLLSPYEDIADLLEKTESYARLYKAIGKLTEIQRRRLCLYYIDELSYSRIARVEGVTHRTVINSVKLALKRLNTLY